MAFRVGMGYDIHRFKSGRKLILGGVEVPHTSGLDGHSDADVLLHAVCDAILGALGRGDIGEHFSNKDPRWKDADSAKLLSQVFALAKKDGYKVVNVDTVIQAEEPNLKNYKAAMRANIAKVLSVDESCVNIKATTQEGLGAIGEKKGMAAFATVLLEK